MFVKNTKLKSNYQADAFFDCISVDLETGLKNKSAEVDEHGMIGVEFELHKGP